MTLGLDLDQVLFHRAVDLLDRGLVDELDAFLNQHPSILSYRCHTGDWYEKGYFKGATLLNHVAGNPIRCPLPPNIVEVARVLLNRGADPNIATEAGWTTIGLILTGKQVADAGVGVELIDLLKAAGARDVIDAGDVLSQPLWNGGRATAEELSRRGAPMDLRHAAALGMIDEMSRQLNTENGRALIEEALIYASHQGEEASAQLLIEHGAKGDVFIESAGGMPAYAAHATALHMAAWSGQAGIVRLLLEKGASAAIVEPTYNGTALGWAEYAGHAEIADMLSESLTERGLPIQTFVTEQAREPG